MKLECGCNCCHDHVPEPIGCVGYDCLHAARFFIIADLHSDFVCAKHLEGFYATTIPLMVMLKIDFPRIVELQKDGEKYIKWVRAVREKLKSI